MNYQNPNRRCTECKRWFTPDPRVGDRQVTCGAEDCQKKRHAKKCKQWHELHPEAASNHYCDVVKPYRHKHPTYQRRHRILATLSKIREELLSLARRSGEQLASLISRGRRVFDEGAQEPAQARAMTGKPLAEALESAASMVKVVAELSAQAGQPAVDEDTP